MGPDVAQALLVEPTGFPVWPRNKAIVDAFTAVGTQWTAIGTGTGGLFWMGLDYMRVRAAFEFEHISLSPRQWRELRVMENAARSGLNGVRG